MQKSGGAWQKAIFNNKHHEEVSTVTHEPRYEVP